MDGGALTWLCADSYNSKVQLHFFFFFTKYQIKVALFLYFDYYFKPFIACFCLVMALCSAASIRKIKMGVSVLHQLLANHPNL